MNHVHINHKQNLSDNQRARSVNWFLFPIQYDNVSIISIIGETDRPNQIKFHVTEFGTNIIRLNNLTWRNCLADQYSYPSNYNIVLLLLHYTLSNVWLSSTMPIFISPMKQLAINYGVLRYLTSLITEYNKFNFV